VRDIFCSYQESTEMIQEVIGPKIFSFTHLSYEDKHKHLKSAFSLFYTLSPLPLQHDFNLRHSHHT
jgi:hypothetical protein